MRAATLYAMAEGTQRRLAAIFAADVAGYSRLMGADEEGTIAALRTYRQEVFDPKLAEYNGRIANTGGDSLLIEFPSAVDALRCAIDVQREMADRNEDVPEERRFEFRIGINVGDIVSQGDDLLGDGVNVAARLEGLAEPGGIRLSRTARDQVRDRMDIALDDMGEVEVKNIARPVRVFRVLPEGEAASAQALRAARPWLKHLVAALVILAVIASGGAWWWSQHPDFEPADPLKFAYRLPEKPSIAVLPFDNLSGDDAQDYISDGLTENIIAVLATSPDLFVIARNSSFTYKGKATKVQEVAEQLGVRYVLEGSVQRSGDQLRVTAQLVDALNGRHLWAQRYDRELKNLFDLQDDITQSIALEMQVNLVAGETSRIWSLESNGDLEVLRLYREANAAYQTWSVPGNRRALELVQQGLERQPKNALLLAMMGWIHWQNIRLGVSQDVAKDRAAARQFAEQSRAANVAYPSSYLILSLLDVYTGNHESAISLARQGASLAPNSGIHIAIAASVLRRSGQPREAIQLLSRALQLQRFPNSWLSKDLAYAYLMTGEIEKAKAIFEGLLNAETPNVNTKPDALRGLVVVSVWQGKLVDARGYLADLLKIRPDLSVAGNKKATRAFADRTYIARYLDALRKAGLPEHSPSANAKKPSIAVLPFRNLSGAQPHRELGDVLALEVSDRLSKVKLLRVIGRSSMGRYKKGNINPVAVAKEMKNPVDYLVFASVQTTSERVLIFAELLATKDGRQVWSRKFEGELPFANPFEFQEQVALGIATAVSGGYGIIAQLDRKNIDPTSDRPLSEYECTVLTFLMVEKGNTAKPHLDARNCWERIVEGNPNHADALGWLAMIYRLELSNRLNPRPKPLDRAFAAANKAVTIDPKSQIANLGLTDAYFGLKRKDEFVAAARKTISLDPDNLPVIGLVAFLLDHYKLFDLSVPLLERVTNIDPYAPFGYFLPLYEDAHRNEEYKKALELSLAHDPPGFIWTYIRRAMYYAQLGDKEKATENVTEILKQQPDFGEKIVQQLRSWGGGDDDINRYVRDLSKAGIDIRDEGS